MKKLLTICVMCILAAVNFASADLFGTGNNQFTLDFVNIGNAGNAADTNGHGAVGYNYRIGKYEITNANWDTFVAGAGLLRGNPSSAYDTGYHWYGGQMPTSNVSWYEAAQFCNWLTSGDKSQGAYLFSGDNYNAGDFEGIDRAAALSAYDTVYVIPTEDEWYKAAYYTGSGYSLYANGTNTAPTAGVESQYDWHYTGNVPWNVGTGTAEQNGTFDMMGNLWEWTETYIVVGSEIGRVSRGGSYYEIASGIRSSRRSWPSETTDDYANLGFRIAVIPEPATICLLGLGALSLVRRKK